MSKKAKNGLKDYERHAIGFMLQHLAWGSAGGAMFGGLLLALDVGGLRSLILASSDGPLALILFFFGLFITFGGAGMGIGVMSQGRDLN
jgi:hypothetical protein